MRDQLLGGRYRLVRQLGEGGMGQVWEAQDETLGRPVAVKLISLLAGGGSRGDEARARFLREARITAQLQHPNIVTIHDLGETGTEDNKVPFLVMELVRGEGLDATLRRGVVTLPDAARWGAQICDALADAHGARIMHRDIKPSNILITPSGIVKVLDFGVARAADPYATADRLTQTGFIVGTPPYMAPEQARGFPEPRSDLYALGCLLFELITGQLPFQAPDTLGYLSAHLTQEPPTPSSVAQGIPPAWDDLVLTLLHKDPTQRYLNAPDLSQALLQLDHTHVPPQLESRAALLAQLATAMRAAHDVAATRIADALSHTQHLLRQLDRVPEPEVPAGDRTRPFTTPGTTPLPPAVSTPRASRVSPQPDTAPTIAPARPAGPPKGRDRATMERLGPAQEGPGSRAQWERFGPPAAVFVLVNVSSDFWLTDLGAGSGWVFVWLVRFLVVGLLVFTAVLTPRSIGVTRGVGYVFASFNAIGFVLGMTLGAGPTLAHNLPLFNTAIFLSIAAYCYRDIKTRRARSAHPRASRVSPQPDTAPTITPPRPDNPPADSDRATPKQPSGSTATAAITLSLLCLLTVPVIPIAAGQAVNAGAVTSGEFTTHAVLCGIQATVLAIGALMLRLRNTSGRWLIAAGGTGLALQAVYAVFLFNFIGRILFDVLPVTAIMATAAVITAVLPTTGRWCLRQS